ncbi:hypothetical protein [Simiduia agarivorans]|nr:hypothetical protein [Simiduia agarivorans]
MSDKPAPREDGIDPGFERFLRQLPEEQTISDEIAIRLAHARASAVASHARHRGYWPYLAIAASILLVGVMGLINFSNVPHNTELSVELAAELDMIMDENERELIDDLEFYQWLSEMEAG